MITQGRWKYKSEMLDAGGWNFPHQWITIYADETIIAYYDTASMEYPETTEENKDNARLIAAAPDLLKGCKEALKALRIVYDNTDDEDILAKLDCWPLSLLREAITKATGNKNP